MDLPENLVEEFRDAWTEEFGEVLSVDEARRELRRLVDLCWTLARPVHRETGSVDPSPNP